MDVVQPAVVSRVASICCIGYLELDKVPAPPWACVGSWVGSFEILSSLFLFMGCAPRVCSTGDGPVADCLAVIGPWMAFSSW